MRQVKLSGYNSLRERLLRGYSALTGADYSYMEEVPTNHPYQLFFRAACNRLDIEEPVRLMLRESDKLGAGCYRAGAKRDGKTFETNTVVLNTEMLRRYPAGALAGITAHELAHTIVSGGSRRSIEYRCDKLASTVVPLVQMVRALGLTKQLKGGHDVTTSHHPSLEDRSRALIGRQPRYREADEPTLA